MKLAIMQPYFLPYLGYFQLMAAVDKFVIYDDVRFINRGWINRNRILVKGRDHLFTVPLRGASQNRNINEIAVVAEKSWREKLLRTFDSLTVVHHGSRKFFLSFGLSLISRRAIWRPISEMGCSPSRIISRSRPRSLRHPPFIIIAS